MSSSFGFEDLIEDADGYLIARAVRNNKTTVDAVKDHYQKDGGLRRFNNYSPSAGGTRPTARTPRTTR
ncbi:hypothetical protein [Streptomyces viridochromogenes]|uniref:hypothetical protein n=1 Tax=Streptomyces viridochromogenes TaxID=1938 RepID=UPI0001B4E868|nr:hypothetical protein [Streptomyces viridochromogenes]